MANNLLHYQCQIIILFISILIIIIAVLLFLLYKITVENRSLTTHNENLSSFITRVDDVFVKFKLANQHIEFISPNTKHIIGIDRAILLANPGIFFRYIDDSSKRSLITLCSFPYISSNYQLECQLMKPDSDQNSWLNIQIYPLHQNNKLTHYLFMISDITNFKNSQLILKNALCDLQGSNTSRKNFLNHMSHEIKSPIHAILNLVQLTTRSLQQQQKVENYLKKITYTSNNLLALVNNILDMAKIECDKLILKSEPFRMIQTLDSLTSVIHAQTELTMQKFIFKINHITDNELIGDSLRLCQILNNCISNSFRYTPKGGTIRLIVMEIERTPEYAIFQFIISDNGVGMSEEYLKHIFYPFEQEGNPQIKCCDSTGVGMTIVKELVSLMDGNIQVSSSRGSGTIITIHLRFKIPALEEGLPYDIAAHANTANCSLSGHRILVVEDNIIHQEIMHEILDIVKIKVHIASNGYDALRLFQTSEPGYYDMIISDLYLPEISGIDLAAKIRSSEHHDAKKICIMAMSAEFNDGNTVSHVPEDINYRIEKPINIPKFYQLLNHIFLLDKSV